MAAAKDMTALRKRVFEIIEIGSPDDYPSRVYDFVNMLAIVANLTLRSCIPLRSSEARTAQLR